MTLSIATRCRLAPLTGERVLARTLVLIVACTTLGQPVPAQSKPRSSAPAARADGRTFAADSFWVVKWRRGGFNEEDLFVEPRKLVAVDSVVAVLDLGTREVHLLSSADGATKRLMKASGSGPGEFKQPVMLLRDQERFGILDGGNARLTMFSPSGVLKWDMPIPSAAGVEGACALSGAKLLVKNTGRLRAITLSDSSGKVSRRFSLPGDPADSAAPTFGASAFLAGPSPAGLCAIVPRYGATWHTMTANGMTVRHAYIEAGAKAVVEVAAKVLEKQRTTAVYSVVQKATTDPIARGAQQIGDTLIVSAGSTKRDPFRLLDYYLISSGRYLYSRKLPQPFTGTTIGADGTFYAAGIAPEVSWVVALRPSRIAPPVKEK